MEYGSYNKIFYNIVAPRENGWGGSEKSEDIFLSFKGFLYYLIFLNHIFLWKRNPNEFIVLAQPLRNCEAEVMRLPTTQRVCVYVYVHSRVPNEY